MITLQSLPKQVIEILSERIMDEQAAFYFYISAGAWCQLNGYEKAAAYFDREAKNEKFHFQNIVNFLSNWNTKVQLNAIAEPAKDFTSLQDIIEKQYQMEYELLCRYEKNALQLFAVSQIAYSFIHNYVNIQNEAVIEAATFINKIQNYLQTDPGLVLFEEEIFGPMIIA